MGYESISTIVVLVVLVIVMVVWLPRRTVNSMKRVIEHREDRFSSSLHLVDAHSGTRFCDDDSRLTKGAYMHPTQISDAGAQRHHIVQVRAQRHAAVRRRRIIVSILSLVTLAVLALSFLLHFNALFTLIPAALVGLVLIFGVRASRQARAWERKVAQQHTRVRHQRAKQVQRNDQSHRDIASDTSRASSDGVDHADSDSTAAARQRDMSRPYEDDAQTDVMEQREIRRALKRAEEDKDRVLTRRSLKHNEAYDALNAADVSDTDQIHDADSLTAVAYDESHDDLTVADSVPTSVSDATSELSEIHPARVLDAFDMAAQQDLISFSLGTQSGDEAGHQGPESLEIKSMRQVAVARPREMAYSATIEPVDALQSSPLDARANDAKDGKDGNDANDENKHEADAVSNDASSFHEAEIEANVDIPVATSDSLGADLEAVLARRSS
jgi:hypothetical protein